MNDRQKTAQLQRFAISAVQGWERMRQLLL
jgi:hypothetical protein